MAPCLIALTYLLSPIRVGYGEIVAQGYLRYLMGVEGLVGLILITWSASFLFIEMQKYWTASKTDRG